MKPLYLIICVVVIALLVVMMTQGVKREPRYRGLALLTGNEVEFFRRLRRALPDEFIFPQVALSALIAPVSSGKSYQYDFRRISQKRVDYAIYSQDLRLVAIVELDDRTHDASRDAVRDRFIASAGIRTVRFQSKRKPDEAQIRAALYPERAHAARASNSAGARAGMEDVRAVVRSRPD